MSQLRVCLPVILGVAFIALPQSSAHPGVHEEIERLDELIAASPERSDLYVARAGNLRLAGHHEVALLDLDAAEEIAPQDTLINLHRGFTLAEMNRDTEADAAFSKYLDGGAGNASAFAERGRVRERLGRFDDALADYASALALQPEVQLVLLRGELLEKTDRLSDAADCYRAGLSQLDGAPAIRQALVRTEIARKQFGAALAAIDEGLTTIDERLAASPARTPWLMRKAEVLDFAGQPAEAMDARRAALAEIDRVLAFRPNAIHLVTRAEICAALGILEEAKRSIAEALSKAPHYRAAQELQARLQSQPDGE